MRKIAISLAILCVAATARAEVVTFQQGVNGYMGTRDTGLLGGDPDSPQGSSEEISIDGSDGGFVDEALIAFDDIIGDGANQIPKGSKINSATLTLQITSDGSGWNFHRMLIDWDANTVTWNNVSVTGGIQADGVEAAAVATYSAGANDGNKNITATSGNVIDDLTADVQAWANGDPNYGWAILPFIPNGTNGIDFFSSDYAAGAPLLTVDYSPVPEPGSIALLFTGLALCGLIRWKHRK